MMCKRVESHNIYEKIRNSIVCIFGNARGSQCVKNSSTQPSIGYINGNMKTRINFINTFTTIAIFVFLLRGTSAILDACAEARPHILNMVLRDIRLSRNFYKFP